MWTRYERALDLVLREWVWKAQSVLIKISLSTRAIRPFLWDSLQIKVVKMEKGGKGKEVKVGKQIYVKMKDFTMGIYIKKKKKAE